MTIAKAFKVFIKSLTGQEPIGNNIADVVNDGAQKVVDISILNNSAIKYEDSSKKSFTLKSSTASSTKEFKITVVDDGTISATEIK